MNEWGLHTFSRNKDRNESRSDAMIELGWPKNIDTSIIVLSGRDTDEALARYFETGPRFVANRYSDNLVVKVTHFLAELPRLGYFLDMRHYGQVLELVRSRLSLQSPSGMSFAYWRELLSYVLVLVAFSVSWPFNDEIKNHLRAATSILEALRKILLKLGSVELLGIISSEYKGLNEFVSVMAAGGQIEMFQTGRPSFHMGYGSRPYYFIVNLRP